jgi:hypothetical protein
MGCNCGRLQRENDELRQRVREYENGSDDFDEDEDEDEYEDVYEMSDRFDEPSEPAGGGYDSLDYDPRRSVGTMGGRLGDGHVRDARRAYRKYNAAISRGQTYGSDIWRYSAGEKFKADSPIERATMAVSRFNKSRWH